MPTPKPEKKYNCSQAELYAICNIGWGSFIENLVDFTAFNTLYTPTFATDRLTEVEDAEALPDDQARGTAAELLRINMLNAADAAILKWKSLRSYIKKSYPAEEFDTRLDAAGYGYYETATHEDWEDLKLMLVAGNNFITANTAALTAGGMPAAFPAAYVAAGTAYQDLYASFKDAEQDSKEGTDIKVEANNAIYDKLMEMFEDGQVIYDKAPAKRDRFIFQQVKNLVTPPGGGETILRTDTGSLAPSELKSLGAIPGGTNKIRMTMVSGGPGEFGLGDGTAFNGNTTAMGAPAVTTYTLAEFASTGTVMMVKNQNTTAGGEYKVEYLG